MNRVYNFAAGPAMLPESVLKIAQADMLDWQNTGMSVMEVSHRGHLFKTLLAETEALLRELMDIPAHYQVLFLPGGGRLQFSMVPMNLLAKNSAANYLVTGIWSKLAYEEAQKYGDIQLVASSENDGYLCIPKRASWNINLHAKYFYYTPNETVAGVEFSDIPRVEMPLVADMTSCILSRIYPIDQFGIIFAAAQKNLGQAGVTVVIIREDLVEAPLLFTPSLMEYRKQIEQHSLLNTAPTYAIYMMNLVLRDLKAQGGVAAMEKRNSAKAALLYETIDHSDFYVNRIAPEYRSRMNITFSLPTVALEQQFLAKATQSGLTNLKGHASIGGIRASLYNAMPLIGVQALVEFMEDFR